MLQKIISIIAILFFSNNILLASDITAFGREGTSIDLTKGSQPTDLPFGYYISEFSKSSIKGYDQIDLSDWENKKLLIGYGTYDIKDENCRYLDVPSNSSFEVDFDNITVLDNKTYGISRQKMTYSQCLSKAAQYSGYIFTPKDASTGGTVNRTLGREKSMWVGYSKQTCESDYKNNEGFAQSYENFIYPVEYCTDENKFTYKLENSTEWLRTSENDRHYCPIQINSPDYLRPVKFCMPWWRVERTWKLNKNDDLFEFNGKTYDMRYAQYIIDYPKDEVICTKMDTNRVISGLFKSTIRAKVGGVYKDVSVACFANEIVGTTDLNTTFKASCTPETASTRYGYFENPVSCTNATSNDSIGVANCKQVKSNYVQTCNTFYDIKASPTCLENINQEVCRVNQCQGYIQDVCKKVSSYTPYKDYDVGYIMVDGIETKVKTKEKKEIHTYHCPQPSPSSKHCLETEKVIVFPAHCPGTFCDELSTCLREDNIDATECMKKFPCEKSYGSVDNIIRDSSGNAIALGGNCSDGSSIEARIEVLQREKSVCKKFSENISFLEEYKSCISMSSKSYKTVSTSIIGDDEYSLDDRCIRINNLEESRPSIESVFKYTTEGYFKTNIKKAYIDGEEENEEAESGEYLLNASQRVLVDVKSPENSEPVIVEDTLGSSFCAANYSSSWMKSRFEELGAGDPEDPEEPVGKLKDIIGFLPQKNSGGNIYKCKQGGVVVSDKCELPASEVITGGQTTYNCNNYDGYSLDANDNKKCISEPYYNYPFIAVSSNKATCDTYKTLLGLTKNTNGRVFYQDYNFSSIGVSQNDVENNNLCIIGGNKTAEDSLLEYIKVLPNNSGIEYKYSASMNQLECNSRAACFSGEALSNCHIIVNDETMYRDEPADFEATKVTTTKLEKKEGSFVGNINGYTDIFAVQEYLDGEFGYYSNYTSKLPLHNIVKLDEREISPIIEQAGILYPIKYDWYQKQLTQTTKNRNPDGAKGSGSGLYSIRKDFTAGGLASQTGVPLLLYSHMLILDPLYLTLTIVSLFSSPQKWGQYESDWRLYEYLMPGDKYVPNVYGYDPRILKDGILLHSEEHLRSGTMKKDNYSNFRTSTINNKKSYFDYLGYDSNSINEKMISSNEKNAIGWASIKWYKPSGKKTRTSIEGLSTTDLYKRISTVYMGAVNSLSIVVPYKGDYEVKAYDKNDNLLASITVQEQNFISGTNSTTGNLAHTYAKVQMALANDFNIAPEQNKELEKGSCLSSNFVEWGGGVSGAYYEEGLPDLGMGSDCFKSNDNYVKEHSAVKVTVRATNSDKAFVIKLKKPMPYPNRIVLVNLMQLENRKYECWDNVEQCKPAGVIVKEGENL